MRASPRISPALSGLLNDVVYKEEEVKMSPEEASLLQEEINNISKQIESDTTDLSIVSKSLNRVLELTEDMNTAVDTDTTDKYTAGLLLSEFASIYKDTMGQEFLYSKNLSDNPLEVKQVLTAGLQSASSFIETLKKIAKKIWESLKASWKWLVSKISDFIKYVVSMFSNSKTKQEDVATTMIEVNAASSIAKSSMRKIDETLDELNKDIDSNAKVLDEAIAMVEKMQKDLDKEVESMKKKAKISSKRIELKNTKKVLFSVPKNPTKKDIVEFLEEVKQSQELEKHIIREILNDEPLAAYAVMLIACLEARHFIFKDRPGTTDLNISGAVSTEIKEIVNSAGFSKDTIEIEDLKMKILSMAFDGRFQDQITSIIDKGFIYPAVDTYKSAKSLFKFASEDKFLNNDKYILNNFQNAGSAPAITGIANLGGALSNSISIQVGNLYGTGSTRAKFEGDTVVKDTSLSDTDKYVKLALDAMLGKADLFDMFGDKLRAANDLNKLGLEKSVDLLFNSFEEAMKETDKFLIYLEETPAKVLEEKGKDLINNMFILVQLLNKCNPTYVNGVVGNVVRNYYGIFTRVFFAADKAISDFNKKNK